MLTGLLMAVFILTSLLLIVIVLVQPHYSESGLAGAFGGGGSDSFLGVKAISVASKVTIVLAVIFLLLVIILNKLPRTTQSDSSIIKPDAPKAAPAETAAAQPVLTPTATTGPESTMPPPVNPPEPPKAPEQPKAPEPPKPPDGANQPPTPPPANNPEPPKPPPAEEKR
jgi:protein translocase SecG subunit